MHWKYNLAFILLLALSFSFCKKEKPKEFNISENLPGSFLSFYEKFHMDSTFQMNHIIFPLEGMPSDMDSTSESLNFHWSKDTWVIHTPFNDRGGSFQRSFLNIDNIILEKIFDQHRNFEMERRFTEMQGEWYLIYYAALRKI
jgi:hypothetical protein